MKKDIVWLDYARLIGILLVVFGHCLQWIPDWGESTMIRGLWEYIYLFHMPLFYVISGYLYRHNKGECLISGGGKLFYSLVLPYFIYQFAYTPFFLIRHINELSDCNLWLKMLMGILDGDGYNTPFSMYVCLPCWFILSMIQIRIIFLFVPINRLTASILSLFALAFLVMRKCLNIDFYFCIDSTIMAIPFFLLGYYLKRSFDFIQSYSNVWLLCMVMLFGMIVYIDLMTNGAMQINGPSYNYILPNYLAGLSGSIMIFSLAILMDRFFKEKAHLKRISRNTLFIIFFHWVMLFFFGGILQVRLLLGIGAVGYIISAFILSVGILLISDFVIYILCEKYPVVFGKKKFE